MYLLKQRQIQFTVLLKQITTELFMLHLREETIGFQHFHIPEKQLQIMVFTIQ